MVAVKRLLTLSLQDVTHWFRRNKPRSGFPPNGAHLFLTVSFTVSREVCFEYTKIAYRVSSVKRCARATYLMNSDVKEEKNCQGVKNRVEPWCNNKGYNGGKSCRKVPPTILSAQHETVHRQLYAIIKVKIILRFGIFDSDYPLMYRLRSARFTSEERDWLHTRS